MDAYHWVLIILIGLAFIFGFWRGCVKANNTCRILSDSNLNKSVELRETHDKLKKYENLYGEEVVSRKDKEKKWHTASESAEQWRTRYIHLADLVQAAANTTRATTG